MLTLAYTLLACTGEKPPEDTQPPEDTGVVDTGDSSPPVETGDSSPPVETGDTAPPDTEIDNDSDGVSVEDGDCDDADATVYPGAEDVVCDQVDSDCDGIGESDLFAIGETLYDTLTDALAAAVDGDTIDVCPGFHIGNDTIADPITLTIRGWSGTHEDTELDGNSTAPVLVLGAGVNLTLEDIGIVNGVATWRDDEARQSGGGIWADEAMLTLRGVRFENNTAQDAGGALGLRLGDATTGLVMEEGELTDNRASDNGGGIAIYGDGEGGVATIATTTFTENRAPQLGGAIYVEGTGVSLTISGSTFTTNSTSSARAYGGAVAADGDEVSLDISDTTFTGNTSGDSGGAVSMTAAQSDLVLDTCTFSANTSTEAGGAIRLSSDDVRAELVAVTFEANLSSTNAGVMEVDGSGYVQLDTVTADDNSAGNAGGAYYFDEGEGGTLEVLIASGSLTMNRAGIGGGGGIYATGARVEVVDVDLGADTSTNTPEDVYNCSQDFEAASSFVFDESTGSFCQ